MQSGRYYCQIVMELEFSQQIFEKCSNVIFNANPSSGRRVDSCGQTAGHEEAINRFTLFYERVKDVKISRTLQGQLLENVRNGLTFTHSTFCPQNVFMCFVWI